MITGKWSNVTKTRFVDATPTSEVTRSLTISTHPAMFTPKDHSHGYEWSTRIPFVLCRLVLPFMRLGYFKFWPWKFKTKVLGMFRRQCHKVSIQLIWFLLFCINQTNNSWDTAISDLALKSNVKVIGEVRGQGHIVDPVSNQCTSSWFHVNRTNHS